MGLERLECRWSTRRLTWLGHQSRFMRARAAPAYGHAVWAELSVIELLLCFGYVSVYARAPRPSNRLYRSDKSIFPMATLTWCARRRQLRGERAAGADVLSEARSRHVHLRHVRQHHQVVVDVGDDPE